MEDSETPTLPILGMLSMSFQPYTPDGHDSRFVASDRNALGEFSMEGKCDWDASNDKIDISLQLTFAPQAGLAIQYWTGELDTFTDTITGKSSVGPHSSRSTRLIHFIFKRIAPEYMCFRPAPSTFKVSKAPALWSFALSAALQQVRRESWSWSFFRDRRDTRNVFLEYEIRATAFGPPLDSDEKKKFRQARQLLNPADGRFLRSLSRYLIRRSTDHSLACGICNGAIGGARIVCFSCITVLGRISGTLNTCESPQCTAVFYHVDDSPDRPSHNLLKLRRFVLDVRQTSDLQRTTRSALSRLIRSSDVTTAAADFHGNDPDVLDSNSSLDIDVYGMKYSHSNGQDGEMANPLAVPEPRCAVCAQLVGRPYWYCIQCESLTFICNECDAKGPVVVKGHKVTHDLLRSKMPEGEQDRVYGRDFLPLPPRVRTPTQVPVIPRRHSPDEPPHGKHVTIDKRPSSISDKSSSKPIVISHPTGRRRSTRPRSRSFSKRPRQTILHSSSRTPDVVIPANNHAEGNRGYIRILNSGHSNSRSPPDSPRGRPIFVQPNNSRSRSRSPLLVDNGSQTPVVIRTPAEWHETSSYTSSSSHTASLRRDSVAHGPTQGSGGISIGQTNRTTTVTMPSSAAAIILGDPASHPLTNLGPHDGTAPLSVVSSLENRMSRVENLLETVLERLGSPKDSKE